MRLFKKVNTYIYKFLNNLYINNSIGLIKALGDFEGNFSSLILFSIYFKSQCFKVFVFIKKKLNVYWFQQEMVVYSSSSG